jgi:hypothetical protein
MELPIANQSITDILELNEALSRKDRALPTWKKSITENSAPQLAGNVIDKLLPRRVIPRRLREEPILA